MDGVPMAQPLRASLHRVEDDGDAAPPADRFAFQCRVLERGFSEVQHQIARFDDIRATGAPVLMLAGSEDGIVDPARCAEIVADLRAGGAEAEFVLYEGAYHQWDGRFPGPRTIGRNLADCDFNVNAKGVVRDTLTLLPMSGPFLRKVILGVCSDSAGYLIGRDDAVRDRSNRDVGAFLMRAFNGGG